jgi:hypothetical protein
LSKVVKPQLNQRGLPVAGWRRQERDLAAKTIGHQETIVQATE